MNTWTDKITGLTNDIIFGQENAFNSMKRDVSWNSIIHRYKRHNFAFLKTITAIHFGKTEFMTALHSNIWTLSFLSTWNNLFPFRKWINEVFKTDVTVLWKSLWTLCLHYLPKLGVDSVVNILTKKRKKKERKKERKKTYV